MGSGFRVRVRDLLLEGGGGVLLRCGIFPCIWEDSGLVQLKSPSSRSLLCKCKGSEQACPTKICSSTLQPPFQSRVEGALSFAASLGRDSYVALSLDNLRGSTTFAAHQAPPSTDQLPLLRAATKPRTLPAGEKCPQDLDVPALPSHHFQQPRRNFSGDTGTSPCSSGWWIQPDIRTFNVGACVSLRLAADYGPLLSLTFQRAYPKDSPFRHPLAVKRPRCNFRNRNPCQTRSCRPQPMYPPEK